EDQGEGFTLCHFDDHINIVTMERGPCQQPGSRESRGPVVTRFPSKRGLPEGALDSPSNWRVQAILAGAAPGRHGLPRGEHPERCDHRTGNLLRPGVRAHDLPLTLSLGKEPATKRGRPTARSPVTRAAP